MISFKRGIMIFVIVAIVIMWIFFFWFLKNYGDSVKRDPCSVCAEKMGDVVCSTTGISRTYYQNGTIKDEQLSSIPIKSINFSKFDNLIPGG